MFGSDTKSTDAPPRTVRSDCPDCHGALSILRVIPGKGGTEYWTMRCTKCGGIHLDVLKPHSPPLAPDQRT